MAKLKLPFELEKPSSNEYVTQSSQIGHNGEPLDQALGDLSKLDNISKQSAQSEEQAIIYETDGGVQVGKIDPNGADFANLKRGGQQVARMSDLPTVPTLDTSIGSNPSDSHTPSSKAVKDYVDANALGDLPISEESTPSEVEEFVASNDAGTDTYAKVGSYGVKAKAYKKLNGDDAIPPLDTNIGDNPSNSHTPSTQAVKTYVDAHGGGGGSPHISDEDTQDTEEVVAFKSNDELHNVFSAGYDKTLNKYPNFQAPNISFWTTGKGTAYNRQYGWGGHPYGQGTLPLYTTIDSVLEAQMFSVCGGKGRWNETDTGNFDYGGHLFEGWNSLEDARLTMGIGLHHKDVGWLQVFHPTQQEGGSGAGDSYYGVTIIGSDEDGLGVAFMPKMHYENDPICLVDLSYGSRLINARTANIQKLIETGQMPAANYNAAKNGVKGMMYFSQGDNALKIFDGSNWITIGQKITQFKAGLNSNSKTGYELSVLTCNYHQAFSAIITPKTGYTLPETLNKVKSDGREVEFTYDNTTGAISIAANIIEGYIEIYVV